MKILTDLDQLQLDRIEAKLDKLLTRKKRKPSKGAVEYIPPDFVDTEAWEMYLQHRKEKGVAMKPTTFTLIVKKLIEWHESDQNVNDILRQSVEKGWTGLFEIKKQANQQPEINSPIHDAVDFEQLKAAEKRLDPVDPYADMKEQNDG